MSMTHDSRPLIAHVVYCFDIGGLENGVVNLINHLPHEAYRHVIISLTQVTDFRQRLQRDDVACIALHKPPGQTLKLFPRLYRLLRELRPAIVHTRNLAALECQLPAWAAGVPIRIHGEHGWDVDDLGGASRKHRLLRRLYSPLVTRYVALSRQIAAYLQQEVGIGEGRIAQIYNGVDSQRFHGSSARPEIVGCPFSAEQHWLLGTVGRMQQVKNQTLLAQAFVRALQLAPQLRSQLRLVLVGEGPLRAAAHQLLAQAGCLELAWLPGARNDVADILRGLHGFALPSLSEGISNTILEAMASGLPVIATDVGGNAELVAAHETGYLCASGDVEAMAQLIVRLASDPAQAQRLGQAGRARIERQFSLSAMVAAYQQLYDQLLGQARLVAR